MILDDDEAGSVILGLQRATHASLHALAVRLAAADLTASEINTLANLADSRARSVGELAADTALKPTTLTSVLDRLAARDLLTRELDPSDRRSFQVCLTDAGRSAADAARAAIHDLEREALAGISAASLAGFRSVVRALWEVSYDASRPSG